MPTPISNNSSVYDPALQRSSADDRDPDPAGCAPPTGAAAQPSPSQTVTLAPVYVEGDAGAQALIEQFNQSRTRADCSSEQRAALLTCAGAAAAVLTGVASSAFVIGLVGGVAASVVAGASCGKDLRSLSECLEER